jgi:hypothetical protein
MVQALQRSADPITTQAFSRLGAVLHLAGLLAEEPRTGAEMVNELPDEVVSTLNLDKEWMQSHFPDEATFMDVSPH